MAGEAIRLMGRFGRQYAAAVRIATMIPIGAVALLRVTPDARAVTVAAVAVAVVWTGGFCWWLTRGTGRTGPVSAALDTAVLLGVYTSVLWTDAVQADNTGWLRLLLTFVCVTWQWHTPLPVGATATLVAVGGSIVLFEAGDPGADVLLSQAWILVASSLSRVAWILVTGAARRADRTIVEAEQARRAAAVAAAERGEERELANSLHDTAATTLLMVGTGQVPPGASWLAPQARRDLARLSSDGGPVPDHADLVDLLRPDLDASLLTVTFDAPERLSLPFDVANAVAGATREALNNVRRHAGTDQVAVLLTGDEHALRLDIVDEGKGFAGGADAPATRRGLRESVHGRMNRVGGTVAITSAAGAGTVVRLEWRVDSAG